MSTEQYAQDQQEQDKSVTFELQVVVVAQPDEVHVTMHFKRTIGSLLQGCFKLSWIGQAVVAQVNLRNRSKSICQTVSVSTKVWDRVLCTGRPIQSSSSSPSSAPMLIVEVIPVPNADREDDLHVVGSWMLAFRSTPRPKIITHKASSKFLTNRPTTSNP